MLKALDEDSIEWSYISLNTCLQLEKLPDDIKENEIVKVNKQKGDVMECGNYRGIKLMEITLKIY